jgi:hypothetical protein
MIKVTLKAVQRLILSSQCFIFSSLKIISRAASKKEVDQVILTSERIHLTNLTTTRLINSQHSKNLKPILLWLMISLMASKVIKAIAWNFFETFKVV